jgi:uncharacterized protein (TIGR02284 family)
MAHATMTNSILLTAKPEKPSRLGQTGTGEEGGDMASNALAIETLNELIETQRDGERGFRSCAEIASAPETQRVLLCMSEDFHAATSALQRLVMDLGGDPGGSSGAPSALDGDWVRAPPLTETTDDRRVLEECARGEDHALERYRSALELALPATVRVVLDGQIAALQRHQESLQAAARASAPLG